MFLYLAAHHLPLLIADGRSVVPNPGPVSPVSGNGVNLLLSYVKWGALIACGLAAVASGGLIGVGSLSQRPDHAERGKRALVWSLGGVVVAAIAIPVVNTVFGSVH
jgi:hypothetical protein